MREDKQENPFEEIAVIFSRFSPGQLRLAAAVYEAMINHGENAGLSPPEAIEVVRFICDMLQRASDEAVRDIFKPSDN